MKASVIVPHYNDLDNLGRYVALLRAQTVPADQFEIIVVDNGSAAGLNAVRAVVGGAATVIACATPGAAAMRNTGVAAARGEILAFIDSDCRP